MEHNIEIVETETNEVVQTIPGGSHRTAERIERGVNINLNHEKYHTRITGV